MKQRDSERARRAIVLSCRGTTKPRTLFERIGPQIQRAIPFDAACWQTTDPATILPTSGMSINLPEDAIPSVLRERVRPS